MSKEIIKSVDLNKIEEVQRMSVTLKDFIVKQGLYSNIKGKNYAHVEGWQFAGGLTGMSPVLVETVEMSRGDEIRWKAVVNLVDRNGTIVGRGDAICSNKEKNKKDFEDYAVLSMAQTRAIGKAYRNKIGWVMKLAGYEATPKEEMDQVVESPKRNESKNVDNFMKDLQPSDEEVIQWTEKLESARTSKELKEFASLVPGLVKDKIGKAKFDEIKANIK